MKDCTNIHQIFKDSLKKMAESAGSRRILLFIGSGIKRIATALNFLIECFVVFAVAAAAFGIVNGNLTVGEIIANIKRAGVELGIPELVNLVKQSLYEAYVSLLNQASEMKDDFSTDWWPIVIFIALVLVVMFYIHHESRRFQEQNTKRQIADWGLDVYPHAKEGWGDIPNRHSIGEDVK
jgi:hypothetical protein